MSESTKNIDKSYDKFIDRHGMSLFKKDDHTIARTSFEAGYNAAPAALSGSSTGGGVAAELSLPELLEAVIKAAKADSWLTQWERWQDPKGLNAFCLKTAYELGRSTAAAPVGGESDLDELIAIREWHDDCEKSVRERGDSQYIHASNYPREYMEAVNLLLQRLSPTEGECLNCGATRYKLPGQVFGSCSNGDCVNYKQDIASASYLNTPLRRSALGVGAVPVEPSKVADLEHDLEQVLNWASLMRNRERGLLKLAKDWLKNDDDYRDAGKEIISILTDDYYGDPRYQEPATDPDGSGGFRTPFPVLRTGSADESTQKFVAEGLEQLPTFYKAVVSGYIKTLHDALAAASPGGGAADLPAYYQRQIDWSRNTFGPALRTNGIIDHITKELREIAADPHDLSEWVDVIILGMDGFWRHGGKAEDLMPRLLAKQEKNFARTWPDWRTMSEDSAIEHDRTGEAPTSPLHQVGEDSRKEVEGE